MGIETNTEIKFVDGGFSKEFDVNRYLETNHREAMKMVKKKEKKKNFLEVDADKFVVVGEEDEGDDEVGDFDEEDDEDEEMELDNDNFVDDEIMKTDAFMTG